MTWKRTGSVLFALALAVAGCSGEQGDTGVTGPQGDPGVSTGTITGTFLVSTGGSAVVGATVTTSPLGETATTGPDGAFEIADLPIGTYSITVSGTGVTQTTFANIVVVGETTTDIGTKVVAYSPIVINFTGTVPNPAGFGAAVNLAATVTGTTGTPTYTWSIVSGEGSFSTTSALTTTFTTGSLDQLINGGRLKTQYARPERAGVLNVTAQEQTDAAYKVRLSVAAGGYTQQKDLTINPVGWVTGSTQVGVGTMVIGNDVTADTYAWTLTKAGTDVTASMLKGAATRNPYFFPDAAGTYVLANGTTSITVKADTFIGATSDCGGCHSLLPAAQQAKITEIWSQYTYSAHGDFYWTDPTKTPKGLFAAGIDGEASSHYGASCIQCHTTGYNTSATNGGFDEQGFTFPSVLAEGNFAALTATQKKLGVIGCEACHGPFASHVAAPTTTKPTAFFNAEACGYCHDSAPHHDRYPLAQQSGHSNLELAMGEGTSGSCAKCHSAQGFVQWAAAGFDPAFTAVAPAAADVQPQTCQACHDPHSTKLRVSEDQAIATTSGFTVVGAGAGQLCVTCHTSRRGLHNDGLVNASYSLPHAGAQSDLFFGQNVYFVDVNAINAGTTMSKHALVLEGACVGCHMNKDLASESLTATPYSTNHSFKVSANVCGKCHTNASFEAVKTRTEAQVAQLKTAITGAVMRMLPTAGYKLSGVAATINGTAFTGKATFTTKPSSISYGLPTGHGTGFGFTYTNAVDVTFLLADNATIPGGADATVTLPAGSVLAATVSATALTDTADAAIVGANSDLFKAMWNMALIEDEGSFGGHNPGLANQVLTVSAAKAGAIPAAP